MKPDYKYDEITIQHTCHDMNPPNPYPCLACEAERGERLGEEALDRAAVYLPDFMRINKDDGQ